MASPSRFAQFPERRKSTRERSKTLDFAPKPEDRLSDYGHAAVQQRIRFAQRRLKDRDVSAWSQKFLCIYQKELLDVEKIQMRTSKADDPDLISAITTIHDLDVEYQHRAWFRQLPQEYSSKSLYTQIYKELPKLRRQQILLRYGDYCTAIANWIRERSRTVQMPGWEILCSFKEWNSMADSLVKEEKYWDSDGLGTKTPTTSAIYYLCPQLGMGNYNIAINAVKTYAARNTVAHCGLRDKIRNSSAKELGIFLLDDLNDLPVVIPVQDFQQEKNLRDIITFLMDRWIVKRSYEPQNPNYWSFSDEFFQDRQKIKHDKLSIETILEQAKKQRDANEIEYNKLRSYFRKALCKDAFPAFAPFFIRESQKYASKNKRKASSELTPTGKEGKRRRILDKAILEHKQAERVMVAAAKAAESATELQLEASELAHDYWEEFGEPPLGDLQNMYLTPGSGSGSKGNDSKSSGSGPRWNSATG